MERLHRVPAYKRSNCPGELGFCDHHVCVFFSFVSALTGSHFIITIYFSYPTPHPPNRYAFNEATSFWGKDGGYHNRNSTTWLAHREDFLVTCKPHYTSYLCLLFFPVFPIILLSNHYFYQLYLCFCLVFRTLSSVVLHYPCRAGAVFIHIHVCGPRSTGVQAVPKSFRACCGLATHGTAGTFSHIYQPRTRNGRRTSHQSRLTSGLGHPWWSSSLHYLCIIRRERYLPDAVTQVGCKVAN